MAGIAVFLAGVAMAPVFPTVLAMVADRFPTMTATAQGVAISSGWLGLAVSSRVIGSIAGGDPKRLKTALTGDSRGVGGDDRGESGAAGVVALTCS